MTKAFVPVIYNDQILGNAVLEIERGKVYYCFRDPNGKLVFPSTKFDPKTKKGRKDLFKDISAIFKELDEQKIRELAIKISAKAQELLEEPSKKREEDKEDKEEPINYELGERFLRNPDLLIDYFEFLEKERGYVKDIIAKDVIFKVCLSAYTNEPLNLFLRGPSSSGKTFGVTTISKLFPKEDVIYIGRLSPTALIHSKGDYDEEKQAFIVDLKNKILIFLEKPKRETLEMLLPILSHDAKEIEYRITDKGSKGLATKKIIIRNWPATIFCTTEIEGTEDLKTRSLLVTPEISEEKTKEAIKSYARQFSTPNNNKESEKEKEIKEAIKILRKEGANILIPYAEKLAEIFPTESHEEMRNFKKYVALLSLNAFLHKRNRVTINNNGKEYVLANGNDFEYTNLIFEQIAPATRSGVPNHVKEFYEKVLCAIEEDEERYSRNILRKHQTVFNRPIGYSTWQKYKRLLENVGWIIDEPHPEKKNIKIIRLLRKEDEKLLRNAPSNFEDFFTIKEAQNWLRLYCYTLDPSFIKSVLNTFYKQGAKCNNIKYVLNHLAFIPKRNEKMLGANGSNFDKELEEKTDEKRRFVIPQKERLKKIYNTIKTIEKNHTYACLKEIENGLGEFLKINLEKDLEILKKDGLIYEPKENCYKTVIDIDEEVVR